MKNDKELLRILAFDGVEKARAYLEQKENDIRSNLYERMSKEYDFLLNYVKSKDIDNAIEQAYEIVIKQDILMLFENNEFHINDIEIIAKADYPLDAIYQNWLDNDISYMDRLSDCVEDYVETKKRIEKEKKQPQKKNDISR